VILPDFVLLSRVNLEETSSGMDSEDFCQNPRWFAQYPHNVTYKYNSRGFRDTEWPDDLTNAIWCVGDSFTLGIGSPQHHTWPTVLQRKTHTRCINVSLDGASNQWISRKIVSLSQCLLPRCVVVHWSYIHRRESSESILTKTIDNHCNKMWNEFYNKIKDPAWPDCSTVNDIDQLPEFIKKEIVKIHAGPREQLLLTYRPEPGLADDEDRRLYFDPTSDESADINNIIDCIAAVNALGINVIHSFIPGFASEYAISEIIKYLDQQQCRYVLPFGKLDLSRDGHHYDTLTSEFFTDQIIQLI
jgi:hypothetical protein